MDLGETLPFPSRLCQALHPYVPRVCRGELGFEPKSTPGLPSRGAPSLRLAAKVGKTWPLPIPLAFCSQSFLETAARGRGAGGTSGQLQPAISQPGEPETGRFLKRAPGLMCAFSREAPGLG